MNRDTSKIQGGGGKAIRSRRAALIAVAALTAGCSLQPVYERPAAPVAATYPAGPAYKSTSGTTTRSAVDIGWRDFLTDPRLERLVEVALANNRDLRVAALNIAQADTYIRTWRVKYREHFWRPYTAINFLYPGTNWTPLRQTPCHPEFYAAHGTLTPAGITTIQNYLGHDTIDVTTTSISLPGVTQHYTSLNQIIEDVNVARIYTGFHYRSTLVRSNTLGIAVANWVNGNMMTVLPESSLSPDDEDNDGNYVGISVQENYRLNNIENED